MNKLKIKECWDKAEERMDEYGGGCDCSDEAVRYLKRYFFEEIDKLEEYLENE